DHSVQYEGPLRRPRTIPVATTIIFIALLSLALRAMTTSFADTGCNRSHEPQLGSRSPCTAIWATCRAVTFLKLLSLIVDCGILTQAILPVSRSNEIRGSRYRNFPARSGDPCRPKHRPSHCRKWFRACA